MCPLKATDKPSRMDKRISPLAPGNRLAPRRPDDQARQAPRQVAAQAQHGQGRKRHPDRHRRTSADQKGDAQDEGDQARHAAIVGTTVAEKLLICEIQADVKGRESITGLADDLDDVAKVLGGEGSKQAQAAAAHLRELAQQDAAITTFKKMQADVRASTNALKAADAKAANCAKQVAAMDPPTAKRPPPCSGAYPRWRGVANLPPRGWWWSILLFHPTPTAARERILALFEVWYRRWEFQFAPAIAGGRSA